ncbi:GTD2A protein, partial [Acromyrmex charruanus]
SLLFNSKEDWFTNLSGFTIPDKVQYLLQLGENFALPSFDKKITLLENLENNFRKIKPTNILSIRNCTTPILKNYLSSFVQNNVISKRLTHLVRDTKQFCTNNLDIIFTKADKGNITVALNKNTYISKVKEMFDDPNTYTKIIKNPINILIKKVLLSLWKNKNYILNSMYKKYYVVKVTYLVHMLSKVHRPNYPFRIIFHLAQKLRGIRLKTNYSLISLDVISLFTNIPLDLVIESVTNRWNYIKKSMTIPEKKFLIALELVLNLMYFHFTKAIAILGFQLSFYFRYVDDIVMAVPSDMIDLIMTTFNSFHLRLQLTLEMGDNSINFFDVTIINNINCLELDWYHKPTNSQDGTELFIAVSLLIAQNSKLFIEGVFVKNYIVEAVKAFGNSLTLEEAMNIRLSARIITSRIDDISDSIRDKLSTGLDIFLTVEETLKKFDIDFSKCSSITTDSAKAMIDLKKGFAGQLKQRNLNIPIIHCILHQEALAGKVVKLSTAMEITKIINEIKGGHKFLTNQKFKLFLEEHKAVYTDVSLYCPIRWLSALEDVTELAFITDISNQVRLLNLKLQRTNQNISQLVRHIDSFRRKFQILKSHLRGEIPVKNFFFAFLFFS